MRKTALAAVLAFLAVIAAVSYMSLSTTSYLDVSDLKNLKTQTSVTVKGRVADTIIDARHDLVVFLLEGRDGSLVAATYKLSDFEKLYGGLPTHRRVEEEIVVKGVFKPGGASSRFLGTIEINEILEGCHKAYEAPPATSG